MNRNYFKTVQQKLSLSKGERELISTYVFHLMAIANVATDKEIHDTVLIAAFFCMCNCYVDGLAISDIKDRQYYIDRGATRAEEGYVHFDLSK